MKFDWNEYKGKLINVTMHENYGLQNDPNTDSPIYEIVFKSGRLTGIFDDGLLLEAEREGQQVRIFIPFQSVKCVEIFNL